MGISVISLTPADLGSATAVRSVRLLRAFRVLRLFKRLNEIRKIISALGQSIFPVANAFVILFLIMSVYAIMGVQLFQEQQKDAFGSFVKSLYTMFAATTMDGWQELVVIPMIPEEDQENFSSNVPNDALIAFFFISYFIIVAWTLLPVVVAILLDNFTRACAAEDEAERRAKLRTSNLDKLKHTLDPLMERLSQHESEADLEQKMEALFHSLKSDPDSDVLSAYEFTANLSRKRFRDGLTIYISSEDFEALTQNGKLCDSNGCLPLDKFETAMRLELHKYIERQIAKQLFLSIQHGPESTAALLLAMKALMSDFQSGESQRDGTGGNQRHSRWSQVGLLMCWCRKCGSETHRLGSFGSMKASSSVQKLSRTSLVARPDLA